MSIFILSHEMTVATNWNSLSCILFHFCLSQLESAGRLLKVKQAKLEDSGKYTCLATNAAGEAQQHIWLSVHGNVKTQKTLFPASCLLPRSFSFCHIIVASFHVRWVIRVSSDEEFVFPCVSLRASHYPTLWRHYQPDYPNRFSNRAPMQGNRKSITW